jgi:hypothetical protein
MVSTGYFTNKGKGVHLVLVLHQKLDSLNGGSGSLGNSGRDTSHEEVGHEGPKVLGLRLGHDAEDVSKSSYAWSEILSFPRAESDAMGRRSPFFRVLRLPIASLSTWVW